MKKLLKPIPSPIRLIRENDFGPYCFICGSSLEFNLVKIIFNKERKCIQPKCKNGR